MIDNTDLNTLLKMATKKPSRWARFLRKLRIMFKQ